MHAVTVRETLGTRFDPRANALHLVRLLLALTVVLWHTYALRTVADPTRPALFFGSVGVDGFFAISGFLITRSWEMNPRLGRFLLARARRILPGLWVCLVVTAFVIAPVACAAASITGPTVHEQVAYVLNNSDIRISQWCIGDTLHGAIDPGWDGSLWTLWWEALCYLGVAVLGVVGLLRPRVVVSLAVAFWCWAVVLMVVGIPAGRGATFIWMPPRAGLMFALGAVLWLKRDSVPFSRRHALIALAVIPVGVVAVPDYRVIAAPAIAYLCLFAGVVLGRFAPFRLRNDFSYGTYIYAFPMQQGLLLAGVGSLGYVGFGAVALPMITSAAVASWFLVERPAQRVFRSRQADDHGRVVAGRAPEPLGVGRFTAADPDAGHASVHEVVGGRRVAEEGWGADADAVAAAQPEACPVRGAEVGS